MKKNEEMIYQIIEEVLKQPKSRVKEITPTPGGQTNDSFFVKVNEQTYVVRLPGKGTTELLSRHAEKANLEYASSLGINPGLIYYDEFSGVKISQMIDGAKEMTPQSILAGKRMKQVIEILQTLHQAEAPMENNFGLFQMMKDYEALVAQENRPLFKKLKKLRAIIWELVGIYQDFEIIASPCHIDVCCENLLESANEKIYLIDWEYSGMFDPLFDLATLALSAEFDEKVELNFLSEYFGRIPSKEEMQRIHLLKIFLDYNWALWYFFKETKGERFNNAGAKRIVNALENSYSYKQIYLDNLVV